MGGWIDGWMDGWMQSYSLQREWDRGWGCSHDGMGETAFRKRSQRELP